MLYYFCFNIQYTDTYISTYLSKLPNNYVKIIQLLKKKIIITIKNQKQLINQSFSNKLYFLGEK